MIKVFPKITKCIFHNFGVSGSIQKYERMLSIKKLNKHKNQKCLLRFDGLCILPINMVNDKIYIFLWFWLLILLTISLSYFMFRIVTVLSPRVRMFQLLTFAPSIPQKTADYLQDVLGFGDWLILSMMAAHLDIKIFNDILQQIMNVNFEEKRLISIRLDNIHISL